ncbi:DUF7159 family protein [Mycolicibacterium sphagni]|uniref:DUF7159 family protein n=1 Tax=Mycolicibacterium sphagni TaxID=1786 RepID=UPI0021F383CA|nr:hypothetical protein [Mycolicibacterium sphagni]MCV7178784.1 hypothetical protein [Mycolicibacterium sphagni]
MDIALGVSMTPKTVRMVLVEGEKADGVTVDHDVFDLATGEGAATAAEQIVAAILGTRESATEGGHRLVSTGVTWTDYAAAAGLRDALASHKIDDVVLVSELLAAGALAQAVGQTVGYDRTALMLLDRDEATVSVVETASGDIVKVQTESLHAQDAVAELQRMITGLEALDAPPQGLFVLGAGVDVAAVKSQLSLGTTLPVHAPEEAELALARGAALASATAPRYEASTVGLAYAQVIDGTTAGKVYPAGLDTQMAEAGTQVAAAGYMAPLGYSEVLDDADGELGYGAVPGELDFAPDEPTRKPFLLVGSALTSIFVIGVVALVISLAVSIRPTVDQRPSPAQSVVVPSSQAAAPVAPEAAAPPAPSPPSVPDTIKEPIPVVQQAPRTVYVTPAQAPAPAPVPAAPAPAPAAPAPAPEAPAPVPDAPAPAPIAPVVPAPVLPPIISLPRSLLPPFLRPPRQQSEYPNYPSQQYPSYPSQQSPGYPSYPSQQSPSYPSAPSYPGSGSGGYGSGSGGYGGGSGGYGSGGSHSSGGGSQGPLWPWPGMGN